LRSRLEISLGILYTSRPLRLKVAPNDISADAQHGRDTCTQVSVRRDLVVEHLIGDIICIDLNTLLLHAISQLGLQLHYEIGALLEDGGDLVR
jgi:hypothetical protein